MSDRSGNMYSTKTKIAANTLANSFARLWRYALNFILFPFIVHHVGAEMYGIWLLVGSVTGYFGLLDFGFGTALVKYVAQYNARGDKETINKMINSVFLFYIGVGLIIFSALILIGTSGLSLFKIDTEDYWIARYIFYITAVTSLTSWPIRSFQSIYAGLQRYDIAAKLTVFGSSVNAAITWVVLSSGYGIIELIFFQVIASTLLQVIHIFVIHRLAPYITLKREYMTTKTLRNIFTFSVVIFFTNIAGMIILYTDQIVLGVFLSMSAITFYSVARKLHQVVQSVWYLSGSALLPAITEMDTLKEKEKIERILYTGSKYRCAITFMALVPIFVLADHIIRFWMGESYEWIGLVARVYLLYWFILAPFGTIGNTLLAKERFKPILYLNMGNAVLNLLLSIILVRYYGLLGVVLGTTIPYFVVMPLIHRHAWRLLKIDVRRYTREVLAVPYVLSLFVGGLLYGLQMYLPPTGLMMLVAYLIIGTGLFAGLFYILGLSPKEKSDVKEILVHLNPIRRRI